MCTVITLMVRNMVRPIINPIVASPTSYALSEIK
jgi:hypothetical protein